MKSRVHKQVSRRFLIKDFHNKREMEKSIKIIRKQSKDTLQLSVLGKMEYDCLPPKKKLNGSIENIKEYWKGLLGAESDFGLFSNPEVGTVFVCGPLVSLFLHDLDGKALGEMTAGPYGILRGLGISEKDVTYYLKKLIDCHYLLLIRGNDRELEEVENRLAKTG